MDREGGGRKSSPLPERHKQQPMSDRSKPFLARRPSASQSKCKHGELRTDCRLGVDEVEGEELDEDGGGVQEVDFDRRAVGRGWKDPRGREKVLLARIDGQWLLMRGWGGCSV